MCGGKEEGGGKGEREWNMIRVSYRIFQLGWEKLMRAEVRPPREVWGGMLPQTFFFENLHTLRLPVVASKMLEIKLLSEILVGGGGRGLNHCYTMQKGFQGFP